MFETNKLVRDKVVEFMNDRGIAKTKSRYVEGKEYQTFLFAKLMEECAEVIGANTRNKSQKNSRIFWRSLTRFVKSLMFRRWILTKRKLSSNVKRGGFYEGCVLEQIDYR